MDVTNFPDVPADMISEVRSQLELVFPKELVEGLQKQFDSMKTGQLLQTYWEQKLGYEVYYLVKDL